MKLSPQVQKIYEVLLGVSGELTISEIAGKMNIAASDVYRLAKPLVEAGLVEKEESYPTKLFVRSSKNGMGLYLMEQSKWFNNRFRKSMPHTIRQNNIELGMQLEFVQGRDELMRKSANEIDKCVRSVDLLRSGHEIPVDTMHALVQAINRGVKIRMLIQDYSNGNREQIENWTKNGIGVRKTGITKLRLMVYDSEVGYFMSYKHSDSKQDLGMKIIYPPFCTILKKYFEELWRRSEAV